MRSRSEGNVLSKARDEVEHERPRSRLPGRQAWCGERRQRLVRQRSRHQTRSKGSPALTVDQHSNKSINYCSQEQNYILLSMYCRDTTVDCATINEALLHYLFFARGLIWGRPGKKAVGMVL